MRTPKIAMAIRQHEAGTTVGEICRELEISDTTCLRWQQPHGGTGVTELREPRQLREENRKPKGLVADLSMDKWRRPPRARAMRPDAVGGPPTRSPTPPDTLPARRDPS